MHELAHIIQGTEPDLVSIADTPFRSSKKEEQAADRLASDIILPMERLKYYVAGQIVDHAVIKRIANRANASELMVACRIVDRTNELGILNAAVISFKRRELNWFWSKTLTVEGSDNFLQLLAAVENSSSGFLRETLKSQEILTAFRLGSPDFPALFVQLLPKQIGSQQTLQEEIGELRAFLFKGEKGIEQSFAGCIGNHKPLTLNMSVNEAISSFLQKYKLRWGAVFQKRLQSDKGKRFLAIRLKP